MAHLRGVAIGDAAFWNRLRGFTRRHAGGNGDEPGFPGRDGDGERAGFVGGVWGVGLWYQVGLLPANGAIARIQKRANLLINGATARSSSNAVSVAR